MSAEKLITDTLSPLADGRVYADVTPRGIEGMPRITFQQVGGRALNFLEGVPPGKKNGRFQVNVWGSTRVMASSLARQVEDALVLEHDLYTTVLSALVATYETDTHLYGTRQDFSFWY